ncbi:MAG: hypothetical protein DHS20C13_30480 [Thermodesulfobacteriota bacterium]|nr:MAG: hypothetical protein DHS20C13_30480 [Thermodesulfobacteriota bacterium]
MHKKEIVYNIFGWAFILLAVSTNELVSGFLFDKRGSYDSSLDRTLLYFFNALCFFVAYVLLKRKQWLGNLGLFMVSLILSFFIADLLASRFINVGLQGEKRHIEYLGKEGNCYPYVKGYEMPVKRRSSKSKIDESCVIYDKRQRQAGFYPDRSKDVALVGDSFTFGEGVKDDATLGYILGERFEDYNFLNLGHSGADIIDIYQVVSNLLKEQKDVKQIIYFFNINDALMSEEIASAQKFIIDFQNVRLGNIQRNDSFVTKMLLKSYIYRLIDSVYNLRKESKLTIENYLDIYSIEKNKENLSNTLLLMLAMDTASKKNNVHFQIVFYPLLYKTIVGEFPFKSIHDSLLAYCRTSNIHCTDAYPVFESQVSLKEFIVHPLDYHPNEKANRLVANYLLDKLNL